MQHLMIHQMRLSVVVVALGTFPIMLSQLHMIRVDARVLVVFRN